MTDLEEFVEIRMPLKDWVDLFGIAVKFEVVAPWCGLKLSKYEDRVIHNLKLALDPHFPNDDPEVVE